MTLGRFTRRGRACLAYRIDSRHDGEWAVFVYLETPWIAWRVPVSWIR